MSPPRRRPPPDRQVPQLVLPAVPTAARSSAERAVSRLLAQAGQQPPGEALVHLRCTGCAFIRTLRLAAPGRPRASRVERMLPRVPVRHWVFSLGESAQPRLAVAPRLRARVARACAGAVFAWLRRAAARASVPGSPRCGAVTAIHRVGAALDANVHVHALVLDGVYTLDPDSAPVFHPLAPPRRRDLRRVVAELRSTVDGLVARVPAPARSRSRVTHRVVTGPLVAPVPRPTSGAALVQRCGELDVRAGPPVDPDDHALRARLCRYLGRDPFDPAALGLGAQGRLRYRLRQPFSDGTTHVELSHADMVQRLEALASGDMRPPLSFHGVLAPGAVATWVCASRAQQLPLLPLPAAPTPTAAARPTRPAPKVRCPRCEQAMEIIGVEPGQRRAA